MASSALTTALLVSVSETNRNILKPAFPTLKAYMLSPRQVIDTMTLKHGVATSDDVSALKEPLSRALISLSNLPNHMNLFLLASQRLTRSGQGETDFNYFKLFLETVSGFPSVALCMPGYYVQYPAILQQSLATICPYLEKKCKITWSGLTQPLHFPAPPKATPTPTTKPKRPKRPPNALPARMPSSTSTPTLPVGVPTGQWLSLQQRHHPSTATMPLDIAHYIAENQRLHAAMTAMGGSSSAGGHFGMPVPPMPPANAYLSSTPRPRQYYCWLHGYNNTHDGCHCNVMGANREYTSQMKAATSPNGTGGNPKIGIPVCLQRSPSPIFYPPSCLSSFSPSLSFLPHFSQDSGPFSAPLMPAAPVFPFICLLHAWCTRRSRGGPPPPPPQKKKKKKN
jgi:hypothetical protein